MKVQDKLLIKNTIAQYTKTIISVFVSLFSVRIILQELGDVDYGIYSVVAGLTSMFGILNSSMIVSVQRFFSYEIPSKNPHKISSIYSSAIFIHLVLALVVLVLSETIGLYFLQNYMKFPEDKVFPATIVFHCVIISLLLNIISIPQQAALVAFEKIYIFSIIGIVETLLKLGIALCICFFSIKIRLIAYAILLLFVSFIVRICYSIAISRTIGLSFKIQRNRETSKKILGFAGWNLLGGVANLAKIQGSNILLNTFYGPIINAAYGIANQINSQLLFFSSSIFQASNSPIIQSYRIGDINRLNYLVSKSTKFAFVAYFMISAPILICTDEILYLWLGRIPEHSVTFIKLMLINSYIELFSNPLMLIMQAYGTIKKYFIVISSVMILILPISYGLLCAGYAAYNILVVTICISLILFILRVLYTHFQAKYNCREYLRSTTFPAIFIMLFSILVLEYVYANLNIALWGKILTIMSIDFVVVGFFCLYILFNDYERKSIFNLIRNKTHAE